MPATSQQQQKLMGIVHALQTGDMKPSQASGKAKEMAKSMKSGDVTDFASTKHKGLPKKVKKENLDGAISTLYIVKKPYAGCQLTSLVEPIDPLLGIGAGHEIVPDQVHGVYADQDQADVVANELYETYCQQESMLEEKKGKVGDKIKKTIDQLEKKHKEHINLATQDPKNASKHKEHIAKIAHQIDDLMTKLEKIEKSKKEIKKDDKKKDLNESAEKMTRAQRATAIKSLVKNYNGFAITADKNNGESRDITITGDKTKGANIQNFKKLLKDIEQYLTDEEFNMPDEDELTNDIQLLKPEKY